MAEESWISLGAAPLLVFVSFSSCILVVLIEVVPITRGGGILKCESLNTTRKSCLEIC